MTTDVDPKQIVLLENTLASINELILGKEQTVKLAITCLLARGHLLIEDLPGVGKTTLALALAHSFGLDFNRIQFTSDLLPADVLGISVYDTHSGQFQFHQGPVFTQVLLADEINRATPKTQSALLEAMEEKQASIEGQTYLLPKPFFVIATQNPSQQIGTFPLPESQLDRFLIRVSMGYPDANAERRLLEGNDRREMLEHLKPSLNQQQLLSLQQQVSHIHVAKASTDYILEILQATRQSPWFTLGLSPRAGLALKKTAQAWALVHGRDFVLPEDIQAILPAVANHRLLAKTDYVAYTMDELIEKLIHSINV